MLPSKKDAKVMLPTPRQVAVARAYVEGLERDRIRLHGTEAKLQETIWEVTKLAGYNRALFQILSELVGAHDSGNHARLSSALTRAADVLDANRPIYELTWQCPCGHSTYDHDESGECLFLVCGPICGNE